MQIDAAAREGRSISAQTAGKQISLPIKASLRSPRKSNKGVLVVEVGDIPAPWRDKLLERGTLIGADDPLVRIHQLNKENRRLRALSVTDGLTGLYNKRFFSKQIDVEINRTRRTGEAFSLIFIDLDNFKAVNDTHGHAAGDAFLVRVSAGLCSKIRPTDFACRIGGDEFAVILPTTTLRDAVRIAGRWLELIEKTASETGLPVSASIGVDQYEAACAADGAAFLHGVDQLLYRAKKEGKGKIVHPDLMPEDAASVTREEREVLYHIFRPASSGKRKQSKTG